MLLRQQLSAPPGKSEQPDPPHVPHSAEQHASPPDDSTPEKPLLQVLELVVVVVGALVEVVVELVVVDGEAGRKKQEIVYRMGQFALGSEAASCY